MRLSFFWLYLISYLWGFIYPFVHVKRFATFRFLNKWIGEGEIGREKKTRKVTEAENSSGLSQGSQ